MTASDSRASVAYMEDYTDAFAEEACIFPASFAQERMWFLARLDPGAVAYNIPSAVRLTGPLDVRAFERSLNRIVERHEALRTSFGTLQEEIVQIIAPSLTLSLPRVDLSELTAEARESEIARLSAAEARRPFDFTRGPFLRATLIQLSLHEHVLLLVMHHIVSDNWSRRVFIRELATLYDAFSAGRQSTLPELAIQYADFSVWQRQWLAGEVLDKQLAYWKKQLANVPALRLPTSRRRPATLSLRGERQLLTLPSQLTENLRALSQQQGVTLFMTLLAAFQVLLARYTGQEDVAVGAPIANRTRVETEALIGFFVNTLVLRTDLSGDVRFLDLLQRVREVCLSAYAHQDVPFEKLVEELQPTRTLDDTPLFQVMFQLQDSVMRAVERPSLKLTPVDIYSGRVALDLSLSFAETADGLRGSLEYKTDLFTTEMSKRIVRHYITLLESIVNNPLEAISKLPLMTRDEREQVLIGWNDARADYPKDKGIAQLFEQQAQQTPDTVAVVFEGRQLTYRELNRRANQLAHYLRALGIGTEIYVGICVERSLEMIVDVLGVLKAGGACLPLDPAYPKERLAFMLEDVNATVLLTQSALADKLSHNAARLICTDTEWDEIALESAENPKSALTANNIAYVIFTSGSTGRPKGTAVAHDALINACLAWRDSYELLLANTCHLQMASFSFDVFFGDLGRALCFGAKLVLCSWNSLLAPDELYALLLREKINCAEFVPAVLKLLVEYLKKTGQRLDFMRLLVVGSDILYVREYREVLELCGPATRFINSYGVSEATIDSVYFENVAALGAADEPVPIGRPFANTQIFLLDNQLQPFPVGVRGELHIAGAGLARGYLNRPELTAEKFIPNPFGIDAGERMYRTGDSAYYQPDGTIVFVERIDSQTKIRGLRIEPGEIEAVLCEHAAVRESVVLAREDASGGKHLVAYVVRQQACEQLIAELRELLKERVPAYMMPSAFVLLDELPLTPNGKVDRRALPAPEQLETEVEANFVAAETAAEVLLAKIWAEVLGVKQVGAHDNFFELGGHSLLAIKILSRLREAFQVELPLRTFFEATDLAELAKSIEAAMREGQCPTEQPIERTSREDDLPPSFVQEMLWFLDQLHPNMPFYNIPAAIDVKGPLNVLALERCFTEILRRHEVLRTTFPAVNGRPLQLISPASSMTLPIVDLRELPAAIRREKALQLAGAEARRPFNLEHGPLLRFGLLRLDEEDYVVLFSAHHIVSDAWSMGLFVREVTILYQAFCHNRPSPLPELPVQYADFAVWQRDWLRGEVLERQFAYWRKQLGHDLPVVQVPSDHARPAVETFRGTTQSFSLSHELTEKLRALGNRQGVTMFMMLLAGFQVLLARYTGQDDIVIGNTIANRNRLEIESLIGFLTNTQVLRTDLSGEASFLEVLRRVREVCLGAYAHQDLPFKILVEELAPERDLSRNPFFQIVFIFQNTPVSDLKINELSVNPIRVDNGTAKFDLSLFMWEGSEGLAGGLNYKTDLFEAETIRRLLKHFETLLEGIALEPERLLSALPLLAEAEQRQLLGEWNETTAAFPSDLCLHQLFEHQAAHTPDAVALVYEGQQLSYAELNRRANQLSRYLYQLGAGPETFVGVLMERSVEMVVALLGVLKAGAAYVPLDPSYPQERLRHMIDDAATGVLLTQEKLAPHLSEYQGRVVLVDALRDEIARESGEDFKSGVSAANLAYIIYTSGSTGLPKGVMISHRAICNHMLWMKSAWPLDAADAVLQKTPISFDASVWEFYAPLISGARLVMARPEGQRDSAYLADVIHQSDVTIIQLVPSQLQMLLDEPGLAKCQSLRRLYCGGEALPVALWQRLSARLNAELYNLYGPTEAAIDATACRCEHDGERPAMPIGRPIANTQIYILDRYLNPVPVGVAGELYISGAGLARGYLNRPELTQERFIPNPFSSEEGARMYKTGDLARYLPDGRIEFLGRIDHQVKVRGYRIELGEIEAVLHQHEAVREAVVLVREDRADDKRLVAYVVPAKAESRPGVSALSSYLKQRLPDYMMPSSFVWMESLPLTTSGKLNRDELPAPEIEREEERGAYVGPSNPVEEAVSEVWTEVLRIEKVSVHDNFFELGGHSLLATQVITRLREAFPIELPVRTIFVAPTIAQLSENIMALLLKKVEEISDEEIEMRLAN